MPPPTTRNTQSRLVDPPGTRPLTPRVRPPSRRTKACRRSLRVRPRTRPRRTQVNPVATATTANSARGRLSSPKCCRRGAPEVPRVSPVGKDRTSTRISATLRPAGCRRSVDGCRHPRGVIAGRPPVGLIHPARIRPGRPLPGLSNIAHAVFSRLRIRCQPRSSQRFGMPSAAQNGPSPVAVQTGHALGKKSRPSRLRVALGGVAHGSICCSFFSFVSQKVSDCAGRTRV